MPRTYNIGLIGDKFMGRAHGQAYLNIPAFFPEVPRPVLKVVCGRDAAALQRFAGAFGCERQVTDWMELVTAADVDIVDVCVPGHLHRDIVVAAAQAGKHIICEKPLANSLPEATEMREVVESARVAHMVVFNYRYVPAVQLAHQLIEQGTLGRIYHFRAQFLQDWIIDPGFPIVWRLRKEFAGSGALGDIGAHLIDMARFLVGEFESVVSASATFIKHRPLAENGSGLTARRARGTKGEVTVDDAVIFLARLGDGVLGTFEATRFATGHRCTNAFEVNGSKGSVRFDFARLNELELYLVEDRVGQQGFRTINVTDGVHPYGGRWWPAGHGVGYDVTFVHQIASFLEALGEGRQPKPDFEDGVRCQAVLEAVEESARNHAWIAIGPRG